MSVSYACDGCGGDPACPHIDETIVEYGYHTKAHYCKAAAAKYTEYCQRRDALHEECAKHWKEGLKALKEEFSSADGLRVLAEG